MSEAIKITMIGNEKYSLLLATAPREFHSALRNGLMSGKNRFLAKFRRELNRNPRFQREGEWGKQIGRLFKGYVKDYADRLNLTLGINLQNKSGGIREGIARMQEGGRVTARSPMMVPILQNFKDLGIDYKNKTWTKVRGQRSLYLAYGRRGIDAPMYFDPETKKPLFIVIRRITVKKHYDFYAKYAVEGESTISPAVQAWIDRIATKLERS